ncbi:hypothetical protein AUC61_05175 [Pseudomonas sp. S25]|uniref:Sulfatase-modifying factor enzyme-like domain-containing protein n=1 Tax=Pseudomonas maioricensis TaxID=1766623 RepID=A0ABS9ZGH4_9PSED|nr:SUMF1/EgtB/PvdO family nonheme iron enzyme [Pseudomonas sp. S25]MCI8208923.1 hypothetical protein [Pseudomonas sp. S25]
MNSLKIAMGIFTTLALQGCEQAATTAEGFVATTDVELQQFVASIKNNLTFVEGGEFLMGDFGPQYSPERAPYDRDQDSKPLHRVELSNYSISKFKVTNSEFQLYLKYNGLTLREKGRASKSEWNSINSAPNTPAHIDWYEAELYCSWLSSVMDLPLALPTEAQWEYAARSRGQFLIVATDDGTYKAEPRSLLTKDYSPKGINISTNGDRAEFAKNRGWKTGFYTPLPVDMFPPNSMGLYSMSDNGYEWVRDWYDPDYYKKSPFKDPQGPDEPVFRDKFGHFTKVTRGQDYADPYWGGGINVYRTPEDPHGRLGENSSIYLADKTMRCVVNSSDPVATNQPKAQ